MDKVRRVYDDIKAINGRVIEAGDKLQKTPV